MQRILIVIAIIIGTLALGATFVVLGNASPVEAVNDPEHEEQIAKGTITSVDPHGDTFVIKDEERDDAEVTMRVDENTQYMLNGEEATRDETLIEGHRAQVSHRDKLAIQVDATSPIS